MLNKMFEIVSRIVLPGKNSRVSPMLGRWCILNREYNNRKIDMANVDHCGTCSFESPKTNKDLPQPDAVISQKQEQEQEQKQKQKQKQNKI
jgi:hypothetical protein